MSRVEKFKQLRSLRRKYIFLSIFPLVLATLGIVAADYSVNSLLKNENSVEIISLKDVGDSFKQLTVMNKKFNINTMYINRDLKRIKESVVKQINSKRN